MNFEFSFGPYPSRVSIGRGLPSAAELRGRGAALIVCDANTAPLAAAAAGGSGTPVLVLEAGEAAKGWQSVERILGAALEAGLGRDGLFIGVGGGVVTDLVSFAASVYMRGARLALVPTTLLAMADAAVGGKTGFDLFGLKNLVGTFRPADEVRMGTDALAGLPRREWLSGLAEVVKTAIIGDEVLLDLLEARTASFAAGPADPETARLLPELVSRCVAVKGRIVEADPTETGAERALLNLGHTFGHALEACAGLGSLTHGEAVAWGMAHSCAFGVAAGLTPPERAERLVRLLAAFGYRTEARHPAAPSAERLLAAMAKDKKKKAGTLKIIVPGATGAAIVNLDDSNALINVLGGSI
jgi:3-dehydroquinate synthase